MSNGQESLSGGSLAAQALANLVDQFARPLDFLRELAQNAIDAGTPRIDVSVSYEPSADGDGILQIGVDDYGEGMDEDMIDNQLTRLFSSSKEHDLTKIGKFGIGFTSIFAIRPEAVLLRTGRHGQYWELLFHEDRSFDKVRIDTPVTGTRITLYKRLLPQEVEKFVQEMRFVLQYWCEHSETPMTFSDLTRRPAPVVAPSDDPFAQFADAASVQIDRVDRPLGMDLPFEVRHVEAGLEVVMGFAEARYGFYNGGLTLLNTQNADVLGRYAPRLAHTAFKVKYDRLEHTLTRDNVLRDENWRHAMDGVLRAHALLRTSMLTEIERLAAAGEPPGPWVRRLAADVASTDEAPLDARVRKGRIFRDVRGRPLSLAQVRAQEAKLGSVVVADRSSVVTDELERIGFLVLEDHADVRLLLRATQDPVLFDFFNRELLVRHAEKLFVAPELVPDAALDADERALIAHTEALLAYAVGMQVRVPASRRVLRWAPSPEGWLNRLTLRVGDFGGTDLARSEVLALNGPADARIFLRPERSLFEVPAFLNWRSLLVNRHHPLFRAQCFASSEDLELAAYGLASALLHVEGIEGDRAFTRMTGALFDGAIAPREKP